MSNNRQTVGTQILCSMLRVKHTAEQTKQHYYRILQLPEQEKSVILIFSLFYVINMSLYSQNWMVN